MIENTKYPLISVIVPTFQRSSLLPRAIDSILAQTWENIEIVVVDDNLPDSEEQKETHRVLERYKDRKRFLYLTKTEKIGGGAARNLALRQCHGEYVAFLDDDDKYLPDKLEKQISFIQKYRLDGCYHDVKWFNEKEKQVEYRTMDYTQDYSPEGLLKAHILHSIAPTSIYMFRKDKLLTTEGFGEVASGQDFILMLRCIEKGMKLHYMEGAYVIQYLHSGRRISLGDSKIKGENMLYRLKHQYFYLLTEEEQAYVKFRHYAVLAFSSMRSKRWRMAARYAVKTVKTSPWFCGKETIRYLRSKYRRK